MAILNEKMTDKDLPDYVRKSFRGPIKKVKLKRGFEVCHLSRRRTIWSGMEKVASTWWSPFHEFLNASGFRDMIDDASSDRKNRMEYLKEHLAYANEKGGLRYVVVGRLGQPTFAFFGRIRRAKSDNAYQLYIPNLTESEMIKRVRSADMNTETGREI